MLVAQVAVGHAVRDAARNAVSPATGLATVHAVTSLPLGVLWAGLLVPSLVVSVVLIPVGGLGLLLLWPRRPSPSAASTAA